MQVFRYKQKQVMLLTDTFVLNVNFLFVFVLSSDDPVSQISGTSSNVGVDVAPVPSHNTNNHIDSSIINPNNSTDVANMDDFIGLETSSDISTENSIISRPNVTTTNNIAPT